MNFSPHIHHYQISGFPELLILSSLWRKPSITLVLCFPYLCSHSFSREEKLDWWVWKWKLVHELSSLFLFSLSWDPVDCGGLYFLFCSSLWWISVRWVPSGKPAAAAQLCWRLNGKWSNSGVLESSLVIFLKSSFYGYKSGIFSLHFEDIFILFFNLLGNWTVKKHVSVFLPERWNTHIMWWVMQCVT